jgi:hypothetical protein
MNQIPNVFGSLEIGIWILPFDGLRVVSLSNHLLFVVWCLEFFQFEDSILLRYPIRLFKYVCWTFLYPFLRLNIYLNSFKIACHEVVRLKGINPIR